MNEVLNCLETRRSCRAYRPEQVPEEALQEILRAGLYAPSGMGRQSVKLLVVQDPAAIAALERLNGGVLGSPEAHPFYGAPTVCVVLADAAAFTAVEDAPVRSSPRPRERPCCSSGASRASGSASATASLAMPRSRRSLPPRVWRAASSASELKIHNYPLAKFLFCGIL